uniref:Cytochrome c oxidase subunit 8B n=1 Tax=Cynoglossus semilaevis TaxID=244447 RepID=A0A3P8X4X4_CYNSE
MSLSTAASSLFRGALKIPLMSAARNIVSKPAKETISTGEHAIALATMFVAILAPSGWIMAHLEDYKQKK